MAYKVRIKGINNFARTIKLVNKIEDDLRFEITALGDEAREKMVDTIRTRTKRPQAGDEPVLENNLTITSFNGLTSFGWGLGEIARLDDVAIYWKAVNFGSRHIVGLTLPKGQFAPGNPEPNSSNFRDGRWDKGGGTYHARINRPIPAMNYIQTTEAFVRRRINKLAKVFRGK